jgi:hypothetical protein
LHRFVIITAMSMSAIPASAAPDDKLTFYGVAMMEPIAIPECGTFTDPAKFRKKYGTYPYAPPTSGPCYRRDDRSKSGTAEPMTYENIDIQFPVATAPGVGFGFSALVLDGKIQALRWMTRGQPQQAAMFAQLRGKLGEPTSTTADALQNGFGAKYESLRATWSLPQTVTAVFQGIDGRIDQGKVEIMSEAARARVMEELSKANKSTPL